MAASNALCSVDDVKNVLNITGSTDISNTLISDLVDRISQVMENYCGRTFTSTTHTEYHDGNGTYYIFTNHSPITSVTSIHVDSDWTWGTDTLVSGTYYRIAGNNRIVSQSTKWSIGRQNVKIVYTAGHSTTPLDLKHACITEVARAYNRRKSPELQSKNTDIADSANNYTYYSEPFLSQTLTTLNHYRRGAAL